MIKVKKRQKKTRFRGTHTHGRGFKKKARGKGHRGGVGMAGTGKKADQKKTLILNKFGKDYFGTKPRLAGRTLKKIEVIDLSRILDNIESAVRKGIAKESKGAYELDLKGKKVLCTGEIKEKLHIKARAISASAKGKVEAAGGSVELDKKEE